MENLSTLQAILLGIVQGATEFLPVSSSGHLVALQQIFGWNAAGNVQVAFDLVLHIGTLVAVFLVLYKDVWSILKNRDFKMMGKLILATMPAVFVGLLFKDQIEEMFTSILVVSIAWLFTGTFLFLTRYLKSYPENNNINFKNSFLVGCAQALAIIPGVSRSGSTIAAALFLKRDRLFAAKFSFLMSIIAISGAAVLDIKELGGLLGMHIMPVIAGFLAAAAVGYLCVKWMLSLIVKGRFSIFGYYCWAAGIIGLISYFL